MKVVNKKLLDILACPICKAPLDYFPEHQRLVCRAERLAFPIRDDIPILLEVECESLGSEQLAAMDQSRRQSGP